jgi:hypothetical protein
LPIASESTSHGQTNNGDVAASPNNHPITQQSRALAIAAGYRLTSF